jgi:flagellar hook-associated protein 2
VSSISNVNTNGLNFTGLATGIDTDKLVAGLTKLNQQRIDTLKSRQADIVSRQASFATLKGLLFDLQSKISGLSRSAGSAFDGRTVTSSDPAALTAAAGTAAVPGIYSLKVTAVAQAHQVASGGFADPNAQIKEGSLTLQVGSNTVATITVDSRNNTLQGLADSINASTNEIRASVINDGSPSGYRLMLTATKTGVSNSITVVNNLTSGSGNAIDPTAVTLQAAVDAQVKLGSGVNALTVTSPTNQINSLIPGVALNVLQADPSKSITLTVGNDTDSVVKAVQGFVESYNATVDFINTQSRFDPTTQQAGVLLGNRDTQGLLNELAAAVGSTIPGVSSSANRISSVGIAFGDDGKLILDQTRLTAAVNGQSEVSIDDLKRLFTLSGSSNNPGVSFVLGTNRTKASVTPYQVTVTAPATRAVVTASGPVGPTIVLSPPNNALMLKLNGMAATGITLQPGTYTPEALVAMMQEQINSAPALSGNFVTVGLDASNRLQITSQLYGSGSHVSFAGGDALPLLGFTGTESATGSDVVGHFVVNGVTEPATGNKQILTGAAGNPNTDGLQVRVTSNTPTTAEVTVTQGIASRVQAVLTKYLDSSNGRLKSIDEAFQKQYDAIDKSISRQNETLRLKTESLARQFAAMESAVNNLKGLQSQLASLLPSMYPTLR